ncbi:hypothetical protein GQ600_6415 [Phytophthora cactorum]|nr:hypothetical protein GQ600_6415 [Phytophthora cactorum]
MTQATFAQVYPDCRIKFHSTDIANLIQTESVEAAALMENRRKLTASSFEFVKVLLAILTVEKKARQARSTSTNVGPRAMESGRTYNVNCSSTHRTVCALLNAAIKGRRDASSESMLRCEVLDDTTITSGVLSWNLENDGLTVALYAPNGCVLDETTQLKKDSFTIPLGETGISIEIAMGLDLRRKLSLQPHGSIATIGATADLQSLTVGSLRSESFYDITNNISSKLAQSSIDLEMELELVPSFQASLSLLKGLARVSVKAEFLVFLELNSTFKFPDPFPGLTSEFLDDSSLWHGGNCQLPHYMEYNCNAGYGEVNISIPLSAKIPAIGNKTTELDIVSSSSRSSFSLFSGCVATAYDAEILLSTAIDTVSSLSDEHKQALKTILVWTLGMTDIDQDFVNITSVSTTTGEIYITLSVPPSLGDIYPNAADFASEVYQRARNETFTTLVSNYVGVNIGAQCGGNWWGVQCDQACSTQNCTSENVTCNAVDGTILSCGSCKAGYWGQLARMRAKYPMSVLMRVATRSLELKKSAWHATTRDRAAILRQHLTMLSNAAVLGLIGISVFVLF